MKIIYHIIHLLGYLLTVPVAITLFGIESGKVLYDKTKKALKK